MAITEGESFTARNVLKSPPLTSLLMERSFMSSGGAIRYRGRSTRQQHKQPHHNYFGGNTGSDSTILGCCSISSTRRWARNGLFYIVGPDKHARLLLA